MNELALFAGAGGGLLGTRLLGWTPICAVEKEPYCREVLLRRQQDGLLPLFPIWDDIKTFDGKFWAGKVDVITAGFPCQPFSVAGKRAGKDDGRNLWPETIRVIREVGPRFCLLENVPGLLAHEYFGTILGQLAESGYGVRWDCIPAGAIGAPHWRDRLWIVAHTDTHDMRSQRKWPSPPRAWSKQQFEGLLQNSLRVSVPSGKSGGVVDKCPFRVDRLKALGNMQVPAVVRAAWELLKW